MSSPLSTPPAEKAVVTTAPLDERVWVNLVLDNLVASSQEGASAVDFIRNRNVKISFRKQNATGAMWSLNGNIYLNSNSFSLFTSSSDAFMLSLVAHEALHLKQGMITALSVFGELEAWQLGFRVYQSLGGKIFGSALNELMGLSISYDRDMLKRVRLLMQAHAGKGYRIDLLPLFPAWKEIRYFFTRKIPGS
jgi:hypothetical protein